MYLFLITALVANPWTAPLNGDQVRAWSAPQPPEDDPPEAIARMKILERARLLEEVGELEAAFATLTDIEVGTDPLGIAIRFHAARIGLALGEELSPGLRNLFAGPKVPQVRWGIERREEATALLQLADRLVELDRAREADELRKQTSLEYPRWTPAYPRLNRSERRRRADNLMRDMDYEGALVALKDLLAEASASEQRDLKRQIGHLIGDKMRDDYVRVAAIYRELSALPDATPDDLLYYAYAVGKLDAEAAAKVYQEFRKRFPGHHRRTKATFLIAWTEFDLERFDRAVAGFDRFLRDYPTSSYRYSVRWYRGLSLFRLGRFDQAREDFEFTARYTSATDKGNYWTARALLETGKTEAALPMLRRLAEREPFSYYAMLSRALLPRDQQPPLYEPEPAATPSVGIDAATAQQMIAGLPEETRGHLTEAFAAVQLGHPDLAAALLEHAEAGGLGAAQMRPLLRWLQPRLGTVHRHIRTYDARRCHTALDHDPSLPDVRDCWQALYPSPYANLIDQVRGEVPASLFWAIMRQESYFLPAARSHADALGLMQVIPQVGSPAAEALGRTFAPYELCRPATNLSLFAHAAKERYQRFGGHVPLVLMSYNATPEKARTWLADNHDLPFDLFVEEIPYGETRDYVKRISTHLARYRTLGLAMSVPLLERAGLPHPTAIAGEVFGDVVATLRDRELAQIGEWP